MSLFVATPLAERFWTKVEPPGSDECWRWTGAQNGWGYGRIWVEGHMIAAHRVAYELTLGPIPKGLTLDHLCRNRLCVNPSHLEPVTWGENVLRGAGLTAANARKTHCPAGHAYSPANTYICREGYRHCRACHSARSAARRWGMDDD